MDLEPFEQLIRTRCRLHFKPDSFLYLNEAVNARMRANGFTEPAPFLDLLKRDEQEVSHLVNLLTNNETYFLRESGHYRLLTRRLFPELLKTRPRIGHPVKIVSAGCATGEEPYSLAIALVDHFGDGVLDQIEIVGLDIDEEALHQARMAVYGPYSFRGVDPNLRARYFGDFLGNRFVLNDNIRNRVQFIRHNLVSWPYPEEAREADLIFYRNVSIYYQGQTQREILHHLARLLAPGGYLIMGSVEIGQHDLGDLHLCRDNNVFFFSKNPPGEDLRTTSKPKSVEAPPAKPVIPAPPPVAAPKPAKPKNSPQSMETTAPLSREAIMEKALSLAEAERFGEALEQVEILMDSPLPWPAAYGLKAILLMHLNRIPEAEAVCRDILAHNEWSLEAYLLLGLTAQQGNRQEDAIQHLKKAVYLDPSCWLAHYHLADSYTATGQAEAAQREYSVTLRLLEKSGIKNHGLSFYPLSYSVDQMLGVCRTQMERLDQAQGKR